MNENVKKVFYLEINEKCKLKTRGQASKKKGFKGEVKTPVDFLDKRRKENKDYRNSRMVIKTMEDLNKEKVCSYKEFTNKNAIEQREILKNYLDDLKITQKQIAEIWNVKLHTVRDWKYKLITLPDKIINGKELTKQQIRKIPVQLLSALVPEEKYIELRDKKEIEEMQNKIKNSSMTIKLVIK